VPSILGHTVAAVALGVAFEGERWPRRAYVMGALCSILPDLDVIGLHMGVSYASLLGHRGFSHSLLAAGLVGMGFLLLCFRSKEWTLPLAAYLILPLPQWDSGCLHLRRAGRGFLHTLR